MSIHNILKKINPLQFWLLIPEKARYDVLYLLILVCVSALSFGFGYLAMSFEGADTKEEPTITIVQEVGSEKNMLTDAVVTPPTMSNTPAIASSQKGTVVASSQGTKWHYAHCPGAKTISAKNKISFASVQEAEKAGYTKAANCK